MRTLRTVCCIVLAAGIPVTFVDSAAAIRILMHGREATASFRDDPFVLAHLEATYGASTGCTDNCVVDYIQGSAAAADGSSANGYDVLFLSSTMASSATRDKYENSTVGVVTGENALISDDPVGNFMLSDTGGNQDATPGTLGRKTIKILDPSHPLAAGLSGDVTVFNTTPTDTYWWQFARGAPAPGVVRVAETPLDIGGPVNVSADYNGSFQADAADYVSWRKGGTLLNEVATTGTNTPEDYDAWRRRFGNVSSAGSLDPQHAILAADVGASLWGNGETGRPATATGRRVFFFMSDFGFFDFTADGVALFEAAIEWAAVTPVPGGGSSLGGVPEPACCTLAAIALLSGLFVRRRSPATIG